jgi:acyl carrier protein
MSETKAEAVDNLEDRLIKVIGDRVLSLDSSFGKDDDLYAAGLDSMAIMQLLLAVEEEFGISLPVESVSRKNLSSATALAALLRDKQDAHAMKTDGVREPATPSVVPRPETSAPLSTALTQPPPDVFEKLPMQGADYFVLSFDNLSRKTGQGGHKAHSILMLERLPDVERLQGMLSGCGGVYPMFSALLQRNWLFGIPYWVPSRQPAVPEISFHSQEGSAGALAAYGARTFADAHELMERITNAPMPVREGAAWPKARFSLLELRDGSAVFIFSWSHLMLDGVGAELLLQEIERMGAGQKSEVPAVRAAPEKRVSGLDETWRKARPVVDFFRELSRTPVTCLGSQRPVPGRTHFLTRELTKEQTKTANARCAALCGDLVSMPFYLACAMRAHEAVFARRGASPASQTCSVPIQTRKKGTRGPLFQNHITMFFGVLAREDARSIERATAALMEQHTRFLKERMGESLDELMYLMSFIPPGLYMTFMKMQMRGPFASFFHSHTGEFAPGLDTFFGAPVRSAFHVPGIGTPPGTGIFCNEKNGRMVVTLCWHEAALDGEERQLLLDSFLTDLGVA